MKNFFNKNSVSAFISGLIFSVGLAVSGMTLPQKVVGFLDFFGNWDPSLMFVMVGAISVHFITYRLARKRKSPLFDTTFHVPDKKELTPALVFGAFLFGTGWGLGGFCPGPAIAALGNFQLRPFLFVIFMILGMFLFKLLDQKLKIKR